jgi:exonuclease III
LLSLVVVHDESHRIGPGSAPFAERVTGAFIDREERAGQGASDHAPVVVELD